MIRAQSPLLRYLPAIAFPAVALLVSLLLRGVVDPGLLLPFVAAVFLAAWYSGLWAGLLATAVSAMAAYFAFPPSPAGRLIAFVIVGVAITWYLDRQQSQSRVLSTILSSLDEGILATDGGGRIRFINPAGEEMTGWSKSAALGKRSGEILRLVHEKTRETLEDPLEKALREGKVVAPVSALLSPREGAEILVEESASPVRGPNGELRGAVLVFRDISQRRQALDQTSHSQKMEAVGRLASGVAGDFNNLLTVITGYSELLRREMLPGNPLRRFADEILLAAERAAGVTRQLLSFSHGQVVQPRLLDVNSVIANLETALRRLLGENIEVTFLPGAALGRVKCDPGQIEQIIVNLAMNSRDAMPEGGKFVVATSHVDLQGDDSRRIGVEPGSYVMLAVSDTGCGMDADTQSRLFEPFFTTKGQGRATGLGLSIVYGIVKQYQGQITVYSQPDCGAIFEIYLPHSRESVEVVRPSAPTRLGGGSETVLLVDDEDGVRQLCSAVLRSNGYTVIEAANAPAALDAHETHRGHIDLLVTDVVMPQMNGHELAERLAAKDPRLTILFISGYRDNPVGPPGDNRAILHKPFTPEVFLLKVRSSLDSRANSAHR